MRLTNTLPQSKVPIGSAYTSRHRVHRSINEYRQLGGVPDRDMARVQKALLSDHAKAQHRRRIRRAVGDVVMVACIPALMGVFLYAGEILAWIGG